MTIPLRLTGDGSLADFNFQQLQRLVPDTGGKSVNVRFGAGVFTWPGGSPYSDSPTVAHGLAVTPVAFVAVGPLIPATFPCFVGYVSFDATAITWRGYASDGTSPAAATTRTFYWVAVG